jgi:hypothetical protein
MAKFYEPIDELNLLIDQQCLVIDQAEVFGSAEQVVQAHRVLAALHRERAAIQEKKHELIEWLEDGHQGKPAYDPVESRRKAVSREPTYGEWRDAALQFVRTGKDADKKQMLKLVSLDHAAPKLYDEFNITKPVTEPEEYGPISSAGLWTRVKIPVLLVALIAAWIAFVFVMVNWTV